MYLGPNFSREHRSDHPFRPDPEIPPRPRPSLWSLVPFHLLASLFAVALAMDAPPGPFIWLFALGAAVGLGLLMAQQYGYERRQLEEWNEKFGPKDRLSAARSVAREGHCSSEDQDAKEHRCEHGGGRDAK